MKHGAGPMVIHAGETRKGTGVEHPGAAARVLDVTAVVLAACFVLLAGRSIWTEAKAMLAERLIAAAFAAHLRDGEIHRPWDWADVHPVGELSVPRLGVKQFVLSGASGSSLAFGLGHMDGTALPNQHGNSVLAGHRNTKFAFLQEVRVGDEITVTTREGEQTWLVDSVAVVDDTRIDLLSPTVEPRLTLLTCWPFDGMTPGNQRYVVWCRPHPGSHAAVAPAAVLGWRGFSSLRDSHPRGRRPHQQG